MFSFGSKYSNARFDAELPNLTERTVFLDALTVEDGHCVFDKLPADYVTLFNELARASSDNTILIPWEIWRNDFIQDASESVARSFWEQLSPEPNRVNLDKLCLKGFYSLTIPRSFIHCRHDKALLPGYFHRRMSSRLGAFKLVEMDGSHEVMFTRPKNWQIRFSKQASTDASFHSKVRPNRTSTNSRIASRRNGMGCYFLRSFL